MASRKPFSASDVLREASPRKSIGGTFLSVNRYNNLSRDSSPASSQDGRARTGSTSQKRKNSDGNNSVSYAYMCAGTNGVASASGNGGGAAFETGISRDEKLVFEVTKVRSLCEKANVEIGDANADVTVLTVLKTLSEAILTLCDAVAAPKSNSNSVSVPVPVPSKQSNMVNLGAISKRQRVEPVQMATVVGAVPAVRTDREYQLQSKENVPPEEQGFRDAVKSAEKSTLVFNLNMGSVPILNTDTMSKRATLALTSMAAVAEGNAKENPSKDAVATIDDALSVVTGIHFYGNTTKTYRKNGDRLSGSFCTVPVKYDFNDRDTRIAVEQILRTKCNVNCTTPYPPILRECIRRTINSAKKDFPGDFVKVSVDPVNRTLKVARRPEKNAKWVYACADIKLPREVLDIRSKRIPESLFVENPVFPPTVDNSTVMTSPPPAVTPPQLPAQPQGGSQNNA
jgi:hypothetical protein